MRNFVLLLFFASFLGFRSGAAPLPEGTRSIIHLDERSDFFFDANPELGITDVSKPGLAPRFTPVDGRMIWVGENAPAAWLRFTIPAAELDSGHGNPGAGSPASQWILVARPSFSIILDSVSLYVPRGDGSFEEMKSGALAERRPGEPLSRYFVFELPPGAFGGDPCYLRLSSRTDVKVSLDIETAIGFAQREGREYVVYGILYGILIAMILYSFFLLLSLKDVTYLFYVLYIISAGLWLFFVQGHAKLLFGQHPRFDQAMLWLWAGSMLTWGAFFASFFLRLKEGRPTLYRVILALAALGFVVSLTGLVGWNDIAFSLSHYLGLALPVLIIFAAVARLIQGFPSALYFLIAWSLLAAGGFVFSLMGLKFLPLNFVTVNGVAIGMAAESILLSMALADRFKRLEAETKKLENIEVHYRELSLTDGLTGLNNKRFLMSELELATSKASETKTALSLMLLDIDDFKTVNDNFGHSAGDDILASLAHLMRSCTRESDSSCRFGGDEFVIIMQGIKGDDALRVAERIRNRFALDSVRFIDGKEMKVTVSIGVVEYGGKETADAFLARADSAMYEAKHRGKNCSVSG